MYERERERERERESSCDYTITVFNLKRFSSSLINKIYHYHILYQVMIANDCLKLDEIVLEENIVKNCQYIFAILQSFSPPEYKRWPSFELTWIPFT